MRLIPVLAMLAAICLEPAAAWAVNYNPLYIATRSNAMGGAFVAVADDEQAIFVNPAGLAGIKGFSFNYVAGDVEVSWDTIVTGLTGASVISSISPEVLNTLMGKNLYSAAQIAPSLVMPGFGFSIISNGQFQFNEQNKANPQIRLGYQITNGFQLASGFSVLPKRMRSRADLRFGAAFKLLWRLGGYYNLDFLQMLQFTSGPVDKLHELTGPYSQGIGVDLGAQYVHNVSKNLSVSAGLAMTDLGDTTFAHGSTQPIKSNLSLGLATSYKLRKIKTTLAWDFRHLMRDMDFGSKSHVGLEFQLPFVALSVGLDQMALTYGASFDVWLVRITAASYSQELATYAGQNSERRYALRATLKFGM